MSLRRKIPRKTRLFINPTSHIIEITALGLSNASGGRVEEKTIHDDPRSNAGRQVYRHFVDPGDTVVIPHHVSPNDVKAISPQLKEHKPQDCKPTRLGWLILPLSPMEQLLFIEPNQEAPAILEYTYREAMRRKC